VTRASMSVLSRNDIQNVHDVSLRMLAEVGVRIESLSVLEMLEKGGAEIVPEKQLAYLDERMITDALGSAPKKVRICSRNGTDFTIPTEGVQLVSTDGQPAAVLDISSGKKRPSLLRDVIDLCVIADAMPEVNFIWPPVVATDMPPDKSAMYEFLASIAYSGKHIQHGAADTEEANFEIDICTAILGSKEALRERPIFSIVCTPISPMRYDQGEIEALVVLARAGIPVVHLSMAIAGAVTPVSLAGSLAVINAENLCGITMSQLASRGAPVIYSSFSGVSDLRTGVFLCGTPEAVLLDTAAIDMAKHYGLPSCAGGPANVARSFSVEAGYQTAMTAMGSMLTGADLMVGLGELDRAGTVSAEKLVMDCELYRWLRRLRNGIEVNGESLAFDAVKRQGPGGTFLSDPHTLRFMRKDLMIPQITATHMPGEPDFSMDELLGYSKKRVKDILATHKPPLFDSETARKIGEVAKKYGILMPDGAQIFQHA